MALTYGFYNSVDGDRRYDADQMSQLFEGIIADGVFQNVGQAFRVTPSSGRTVSIGTGRAWFNNTWTNNDTAATVTLPTALPSLRRIDSVVLTVDKNESVRANKFEVVSGPGTSGTPVAPTLLTTGLKRQYAIANIIREANNNTIQQSQINYMVGTAGTPIVTAPLKSLSIQNIMDQLQGDFESWFNDLGELIDGNTAVSLGARILVAENNIGAINTKDQQQDAIISGQQDNISNLAASTQTRFNQTTSSLSAMETRLTNLINATPPARERFSVYRGQNLGGSVTAAQLNAIRNGTFVTSSGQEMWLGDYWSVGGVQYQIAHFNYFYRMMNNWPNNHAGQWHIVVVATHSGTSAIHYTGNGGGGRGYLDSRIRGTYMPALMTIIRDRLGNNAIRQTGDMLTQSATTGVAGSFEMVWTSFLGQLMTATQVFGTPANTYGADSQAYGNRQFALFRESSRDIRAMNGARYWLRSPTGASTFACVTNDGLLGQAHNDSTLMLRPYFVIG